MKVWLLNPPVPRQRTGRLQAVARSLFYNSPPLGLAFLAAVLERDGHRVYITDSAVEGLTVEDLVEKAGELQPDVVGFSTTTSQAVMAFQAAERLAARLPRAVFCIGGPHFNAWPELLLDNPVFRFGVLGEGEITLKEALRALEGGGDLHDVPGVAMVVDGELVKAPPRPLVEDLDTLPLPARHLLPLHLYRSLPNDIYRLPKTSAVTSRGCPFQCVFCDKSTFGSRYRSHSPGRVVEEMHVLRDRHGIRDVAFVESTFTPNRERVEGILDAMEADPPGVSWTCSARADILEEDLLRRMRAAGCWRVRIAIESGNERILRNINKGVTKERFAEVVHTANRLGFQVKAFFMVGHIGETMETIEESIQFARSLPIKDLTVQINTPLKGTPLWEACQGHGTVLTEEHSHYNFFEPVFVPKGMTAKQIIDAQRRFYARFYLRPGLLLRHLGGIRRMEDVHRYAAALPLMFSLVFSPARRG